MSDLSLSMATRHRIAREQDLDIIIPSAYEIFLDIDNEKDFLVFREMLPVFEKKFKIISLTWRNSKSADHNRWHVYIKVEKELGDLDRILIQACLGSDRKRELLSYFRVLLNQENPMIFFEKKKETKEKETE